MSQSLGIALTVVTPQSAAAFPSKNRLGPAAAGEFDNAGNALKHGVFGLAWDRESRMVKATSAGSTCAEGTSGVETTVYVYDATGELALEEVKTGSVVEETRCSTCYQMADHLGLVRAVWDGTGVKRRLGPMGRHRLPPERLASGPVALPSPCCGRTMPPSWLRAQVSLCVAREDFSARVVVARCTEAAAVTRP